MATATKQLTTPKVVVNSVTLTLTDLEAQELKNVLSKVGGAGPRRNRLDEISRALSKIGYSYERPLDGSFAVKGYSPAGVITDTDAPLDFFGTFKPGSVFYTDPPTHKYGGYVQSVLTPFNP